MSSNIKDEVNNLFQAFNREEWKSLNGQFSYDLIQSDLDHLHALNEPLTIEEIADVYFPLAHLLNIMIQETQDVHVNVNGFLNKHTQKLPFIIGIAGSVAVGKSTTARVLQKVLSMLPGKPKVDLVTTDGFLYPNQVLIDRGMLNRKGFPESYDTKRLLSFLSAMKSGEESYEVPVYSHVEYDIMRDKTQLVAKPDILIVEGINVLQVNSVVGNNVFVSDYFNYSIYVDAAEHDIRNWYIDRFESLRATSFQKPDSYFHRFADMNPAESKAMATNIWNEINKPNLDRNILPTRYRADLILEKGSHHFVKKVKVKKV